AGRGTRGRGCGRAGATPPTGVEVRLLAPTTRAPGAGGAAGRFREDLYYRLRVVELSIPPLTERREDVPLLIDHFLREAATRFRRDLKPLTAEALRACLTHQWKGNVRELRSAVDQALLLAPGPEITPGDLFSAPAPEPPTAGLPPPAVPPRPLRGSKGPVAAAFRRGCQAAP